MSKSKKRSYRQRSQKKASNNNTTYIGAAVLLVIAIALFAFALRPSSDESESEIESSAANIEIAPAKGFAAPVFKTAVLSGGETSLQDYAGDVVVINFWATWCPPCKAEMPGINAFYEAYQDQGVVVLAVNAKEGEELVRPFIESSGFTFPVLLDPVGKIVNQYQIRSFPTTLIIDRDGVIQYIHTGMISPQELEVVVTPLL